MVGEQLLHLNHASEQVNECIDEHTPYTVALSLYQTFLFSQAAGCNPFYDVAFTSWAAHGPSIPDRSGFRLS